MVINGDIDLEKKLNKHEYSIYFEPILDECSRVRLEPKSGKIKEFKILLDDKHLQARNLNSYPPILADLLDLAVSIHSADRVCNQNMKFPSREITVYLPLRLPKIFSKSDNIERLKELLFWTTGTNWIFVFQNRPNKSRISEQIQNIQFPLYKTEVALWSGGLDALAGFYKRSKESLDKDFTLIGTGSNDIMFGKQKSIYKHLSSDLKNRTSLFQIPIRLSGSDDINKNKYMRSRGVVFALIGSVVAALQGQSKLFIYENGIGALNLPYSEASVGLDHSRSVHPLTLKKISIYISYILGSKFEIENPFLFTTKTNMLKDLYLDKQIELIKKSMSCDRPHRESVVQCGFCTSCILRRLSIFNANFEDSSEYKIIKLKTAKKNKKKFFDHMAYQVLRIKNTLKSQASLNLKWQAFSKIYPVLDEVIDIYHEQDDDNIPIIKKKLLHMYENYINEWYIFYNSI